MQPTAIQPLTTLDIDTFGEFVNGKIKDTLGCYPVGNASTFVIETIFKQYGLDSISAIESWGPRRITLTAVPSPMHGRIATLRS